MRDIGNADPSDWVDSYGNYLFRYAMLRLRDRTAAEDVVQETFLAALKDRGSFSGISSEATWLVGILKHKIGDHFRRQARETPLMEENPGEHPDAEYLDEAGHWTTGPAEWGRNPAEIYRNKEFVERFRKCLAGLSPNHANAFTLRETEGLGTAEICKILGVSETNLGVILHRARSLLRRCLETLWFGKTAGEGS